MAEWRYQIKRIEIQPGTDADSQLEGALEEYGQQGWELVQVLYSQETPGNKMCRLIFKSEKEYMAMPS